MDIRKIIGDIVRESLPGVVKDIVRLELGMSGPSAAQKPVKTSLPLKKMKRRPSMASQSGVEVGQKWEARSYTQMAGRTIEIVGLGKDKVMPKILKNTSGRKGVAKPISYGMLTKTYDLVK